jgi:acetylornithine deacetylase
VGLLRGLLGASEQGEESTQAWVAEQFAALGCEVDRFAYTSLDPGTGCGPTDPGASEQRQCVVGRLPGAPDRRNLLLFAHADCEPVAALERWRYPPFAGEISAGRLHGWGVADDLAGVAAILAAAGAVLAEGRPAGSLLLVSAPSKRRARGIVEVLRRGYRADGGVYVHPAESERGLAEIKAVTPGLLRFRVRVSGRPPDTREPEQTPFAHLGVNPLDGAARLVAALRMVDERRAGRVRHPALDAAAGRSTNVHVTWLACGDPTHPGRVAEACEFGGSVSFPPGERPEDVQAEVAAALADAAAGDPWLAAHAPTLEWRDTVPGAEVDLDDPLPRLVRASVREETGVEPAINALHAASDIGHPILFAGIPTVGLGPRAGDLTQAGGADEWVDVDDLARTVMVLERIITTWCG